jgi:hypothetical protein
VTTNNHGFHSGQVGISVLEVVIYAALALILGTLAMSSLGMLHKNAFKSQEMAHLRGDADEALVMMTHDLRNLGLKRVFFSPSAGVLVDTVLTEVDYSPGDFSSFQHRDGPRYDTLTFIKPALSSNDMPTGIDTIRYAVNPATKVLSRTRNGRAATEVCAAVEALQFEYKVTASQMVMVVESPPVFSHWSAIPSSGLSNSGGTLVMNRSSAGSLSLWNAYTPVQLSADHRYAFDITGYGDAAFVLKVDSIVAMICNASGTEIKSERFLTDAKATDLHLEIAGTACASCRVGVKMVLKGGGTFKLSSFKFTDIEQGDGSWTSLPTLAQKNAARFLRLSLLTSTLNPIYGDRNETVPIANATLTFNDKLGRSLFQDVIPIPNNGQ